MEKEDINMNEDLQKALDMCRDQDTLPEIIDTNYGIGITFSDDKREEYTSVISQWEKERTLYISITSFRGVSFGAIHYYGRIWFSDPPLMKKSTGRISSIGGAFDKYKPDECKSKEIEVVRDLTQSEIDADTDRWKYYKEGDKVVAFETEEEVRETIDFVIKHRFTGNWEIHEN